MLQNASLMHQFQDSVLDVGEIGKTQLSIYRVYVHDNKYHPLEYALINHDCFQGETECCLSQIEDALSFSVVSIEHTKAYLLNYAVHLGFLSVDLLTLTLRSQILGFTPMWDQKCTCGLEG